MTWALRGVATAYRPYAEYAMAIARHNGISPQITSTFRSWAQQDRLFNRYRNCLARGPVGPSRERGCRYPANPPGGSAHNYGLAWDSTVPAQDQPTWDAIRRYVGWEVLPNDRIHAQVPGWRSLVS